MYSRKKRGEYNPQQNQNNQIFFHCSMAAMFWLDAGNKDAAVHKTKLHSRKYNGEIMW